MLGYLQPQAALAATATFDGFADSTILGSQVSGLTFSNTIILTSGITLNEFEFPPRSGTNVGSDNGGPITITFSPPVTMFSGYFTYAVPLTLRAFNNLNAQVATATSDFSSNAALSGSPGSSPNELLQVTSAGGIARVTITGDSGGMSFTMDDINYSTSPAVIPVVSPQLLMLLAVLLGIVGAALAPRNKSAIARSLLIGFCFLPAIIGIFSLTAQEHHGGRQPIAFLPLTVNHSRIPPNWPTAITVSAQAGGTDLISKSANLLRLEPDGILTLAQKLAETPISSRGRISYRGTLTVSGKPGQQVKLFISIANTGSVRRAVSESITINVTKTK